MKLRPSGDVLGQGALRPVRIGNGSLWRLMIVSRQNQFRRRNLELVRQACFGVRGGASMGPLRCRRWCTRGTLRSECVSKDSARQSTTCRREIIHRGRGWCGAMGEIWLTHGPRYPVPARARVRKIGEYPGPIQHLRQPAVVVDASFFAHATSIFGDNNKRQFACACEVMAVPNNAQAHYLTRQFACACEVMVGMGPKCWSRRNAGTALLSRVFFRKIAEAHDASRVEIHAFRMMSVLVRQRSTISLIVSLESMACSFSDWSKSAGSLN